MKRKYTLNPLWWMEESYRFFEGSKFEFFAIVTRNNESGQPYGSIEKRVKYEVKKGVFNIDIISRNIFWKYEADNFKSEVYNLK